MQPTHLMLNLTADELLVLADRVRNDDRNTEDQSVSAYPLLLRLGSAYVEMFGDNPAQRPTGTIPVAVSEAETWLLRSKVTSGDKTASDALFGVKLLTKLYRVLLAFNNIDLTGFDVSDDEMTEFTEDRKAALKRWMGK